ncbi:MAG: ABC transporter substrate-binding protein [Alphaproteobacteria bacterium]|jgi:branched-chain amino acid transport system substrate-binding protein|nr:ABC transporter substrate-binding protein [Alphaproteobacteria bacterium]
MKRIAGLLTAAVMSVSGTALAEEPIKIGVILPYSGVYASLGSEITQGMELGFATYGAEVAGRPIELLTEDSEVKPNTGLAKAKKLVFQDRVDLLVGPVASNVANALRDFVHGREVPLIIPNAGNNLLTGERCSPWLLRTSFSNAQITRGMGPWMVERGFDSIYLIAADYAAGHQMMDAFRETYVAAGGTVLGEFFPPLRDTKDFGPFLAQIKAAGPSAVFAFFAGGQAIQFVKQYREFGLNETIQLSGAGWLTSPLYVNVQGDAAAGILGILNYVPGIESEENAAFQAAYKAAYDRTASEFAVQGYDTARLIVEALKARGGDTADRAALVAAMHAVTFTGPRGTLRIDPATNNIIQDIHIFETIPGPDGMELKVIESLPAMQDPANGCAL